MEATNPPTSAATGDASPISPTAEDLEVTATPAHGKLDTATTDAPPAEAGGADLTSTTSTMGMAVHVPDIIMNSTWSFWNAFRWGSDFHPHPNPALRPLFAHPPRLLPPSSFPVNHNPAPAPAPTVTIYNRDPLNGLFCHSLSLDDLEGVVCGDYNSIYSSAAVGMG